MPCSFNPADAEDARRDRATAAWGRTFFETVPAEHTWVEDRWAEANKAQRKQSEARAINGADGFDGDHLP